MSHPKSFDPDWFRARFPARWARFLRDNYRSPEHVACAFGVWYHTAYYRAKSAGLVFRKDYAANAERMRRLHADPHHVSASVALSSRDGTSAGGASLPPAALYSQASA